MALGAGKGTPGPGASPLNKGSRQPRIASSRCLGVGGEPQGLTTPSPTTRRPWPGGSRPGKEAGTQPQLHPVTAHRRHGEGLPVQPHVATSGEGSLLTTTYPVRSSTSAFSCSGLDRPELRERGQERQDRGQEQHRLAHPHPAGRRQHLPASGTPELLRDSRVDPATGTIRARAIFDNKPGRRPVAQPVRAPDHRSGYPQRHRPAPSSSPRPTAWGWWWMPDNR